MNERIAALRRRSLESPVTLDAERAQLVTRFYQSRNNPTDAVLVKLGIEKYLPNNIWSHLWNMASKLCRWGCC